MPEVSIQELQEALQWVGAEHYRYEDWLAVGMAIKDAGGTPDMWETWSSHDPVPARYLPGECEKKWDSFEKSGITAATIFRWAMDNGWRSAPKDSPLEWDAVIVDTKFVPEKPVYKPTDFDPFDQLERYLTTIFNEDDIIGYCTEFWNAGDRLMPTKGTYTETAGALLKRIRKLRKEHLGINSLFSDLNPEAGAYIRINPLDGQGVEDENVTAYRYALVESDTLTLEKQNALISELRMPVTMLIYSGGKSLHALVKVDAANAREYEERVRFLYKVCDDNGLKVDHANKNPSRYSRMPGVKRNGNEQFIVAENLGEKDWVTWEAFVRERTDGLPEIVNLDEVWGKLPPLAPAVIDGVLRQGHKMLISGPSKAGKSFLLMELAIAIAEGKNWLGIPCREGKVLYVNMEIDAASCLRRFEKIYLSRGMDTGAHRENLKIWNLRGFTSKLSELVPKLVWRAIGQEYSVIIIDPLYKVMMGDENSNSEMALMCNEFDKIATQTGASVIYAHHFSKGYQAGKKSIDRGSGAGTFGRDPDAIVTMSQLQEPDEVNEKHTAWRIEFTLREFPLHHPIDAWFDFPIHKRDYDGVLAEDKIEDGTKSSQEKGKSRKMDEHLEVARMIIDEIKDEDGYFDRSEFTKRYIEYEKASDKTITSRIKMLGAKYDQETGLWKV